MYEQGLSAVEIMEASGLRQISDAGQISSTVAKVIRENPDQVSNYLGGKVGLFNWFFGQVMRETRGKADPEVVKNELRNQLKPG